MGNYTKESLYNLGIYQVRAIAREIGVQSPTTKKKDELIENILAIVAGETERFVPKNKKGRPAKSIGGLKDFINLLVENDEKHSSFFNNDVSIETPNIKEDNGFKTIGIIKKIEGYLDYIDSSIGVVRKNIKDDKMVVIPTKLIEKHNLKIGDRLVCEATSMQNNELIVNKVLSPNYENKTRINYFDENAIYPSKAIKFKNKKIINNLTPIGFGQRALIVCDHKFVIKKFIKELFNNADEPKLLILCDAQPEEVDDLKDKTNIVCLGQIPLKEKLNILRFAVNILARQAEEGKNTTLFVNGGKTIYELIESQKEEELFFYNELLYAFKNTKNAGSCGLVLGMENTNNEIIEDISNKAFNLTITLNSKLVLYGVEECVDVNKINLIRDDNLLSKENFEKISTFKKKSTIDYEEMANMLKNI